MQGLFLALSFLCFGLTYGYSRFKREIPNGYGVNHPCPGKGRWDAVGHMTGGYTPQKNVFGQNFRDNGQQWSEALCRMDSDGDGLTNGEELGDPYCKWRRGDPTPGVVRGHPGFCEPDREKCDSGMTHEECPNRHARGRGRGGGRGRGNNRTVPPAANDHPQTFLSKNLGQSGGMGQDLTGFDVGRSSFPGGMGQSFGMGPRGGFDRSGGSGGLDMNFGGQSRRFETPAPQSFQPTPRPSFTSFGGGRSDSGSFNGPSLSRDFGVPSGQFIEVPSSGMDRMSGGGRMGGMDRTSGMGRTSGGFIAGRVDYPMRQSPGMDRFSSSLDQRSIQGMGSPSLGPSFQSSMTQGDIERGVQSRMDRVRSRFDGGRMGAGFSPASRGFGSETRRISSGGMDSSRRRDFMGPMGTERMGSGGSGGMGSGMMVRSGSMVPMSPSGMVTGFSSGMEGYPPFMSGGSPGFARTSFRSEGSSMPGASFPGGMMAGGGGPGMFAGSPSGSMMGSAFSRF